MINSLYCISHRAMWLGLQLALVLDIIDASILLDNHSWLLLICILRFVRCPSACSVHHFFFQLLQLLLAANPSHIDTVQAAAAASLQMPLLLAVTC
jgi:hypothetical protein